MLANHESYLARRDIARAPAMLQSIPVLISIRGSIPIHVEFLGSHCNMSLVRNSHLQGSPLPFFFPLVTRFFVAAGISISNPQFLFMPLDDDTSRPGLVFSFVELSSLCLPNKFEEGCPWARPWKRRLYVDSDFGGLATSWPELLLGVMEREGFAVRPPPKEELPEPVAG